MKKSIKIGLLGLGTVGQGVVELLRKNRDLITRRTGVEVEVVKAVVSNIEKKRDIDLEGIQLSTSANDILDDEQIDIVVELIGGTTFAADVIEKSLNSGKATVTANKAVIAELTDRITTAKNSKGAYLGYEAAVGGGIPILRTLKQSFQGEEITEISGIMNGTGNFILTQMLERNLSFDVILKEAQELGYAEADPTYDIDGIDTAHKLIILMNLAYDKIFSLKELDVAGIRDIDLNDVKIAKDFNGSIKLLGSCKKEGNEFLAEVKPFFVQGDNPLAHVPGAFNSISVTGNFVGESNLFGSGAGAHPTASAVVSDILEALQFIGREKYEFTSEDKGKITKNEALTASFLMRLDYSNDRISNAEVINLVQDQRIKIIESAVKPLNDQEESLSFICEEIEEDSILKLKKLHADKLNQVKYLAVL